MNNLKLKLFLCLAVIQLIPPAWLIIDNEITVYKGQTVKFEVEPFDPYDAFRGRYLYFSLVENEAAVPVGMDLKQSSAVYAIYDISADGFARLAGISDKPVNGKLSLRAKTSYSYKKGEGLHVRLNFDFQKYYLEETLAPKADALFRKIGRHDVNKVKHAWIVTKIRGNSLVVDDFMIDGMPIEVYVKQKLDEETGNIKTAGK